jgi:hypothetical protein
MIYKFTFKAGIPEDVLSEERIQATKLNNIRELMIKCDEEGLFYEGTYNITIVHEEKFKAKSCYHEIKSILYVDFNEDDDEIIEEDDDN